MTTVSTRGANPPSRSPSPDPPPTAPTTSGGSITATLSKDAKAALAKSAKPFLFKGKPGTARPWLRALAMYFDRADTKDPTAQTNVACSFIDPEEGTAIQFRNEMESQLIDFDKHGKIIYKNFSFEEFFDRFIARFTSSLEKETAMAKLENFKQGSMTFQEYDGKIRELIALADVSDDTVNRGYVIRSLLPPLREKVLLLPTEEDETWDKLLDKAARFQNNWEWTKTFQTQTLWRGNKPSSNYRRENTPTQSNSPRAIQSTNYDKDQLMKEGRCFRCQKTGHMICQCPDPPKPRNPSNNPFNNIRTRKTEIEEVPDEGDNAPITTIRQLNNPEFDSIFDEYAHNMDF
jgi:hypothetical protein